MKRGKIALYSLGIVLGTVGLVAGVTSCDLSVNTEKESWVAPYKITIEAPTGVNVSVNQDKAKEGDTITVTVTVSDPTNFMIDTVKANDVVLGSNGDGTYSFTMPAKDVTIKATLKEVPKAKTYSLSLPSETDEYSVTSNIALDAITAGTVVGVTVTNKVSSTKYVESVKVGECLVAGENGNYKFVMPAENVSLTVTMGDASARDVAHTLTVSDELDDDVTVVTPTKTEYWAGDKVDLGVTTSDSTKYIKSVTVNGVLVGGINDVYSFNMPAEDVTVVVTTGLKDDLYEKFNVTLPTSTDFSVVADQSQNVKAGALVNLTITPTDATYYVKTVTINNVAIAANTNVSFYMPAEDVTVAVTLAQDPSKVTRSLSCTVETNDYFDYYFTDASYSNNIITSALPGTTIRFWAVSKETHGSETKQINSIRFHDGSSWNWVRDLTKDAYFGSPNGKSLYGTYATYTVGTNDIIVDSATPVDKEYDITYSSSGLSSSSTTVVNSNSTSAAKKGDTVKFYPISPLDYELTGVSGKATSGTIDITYVAATSSYSSAYYKFTMPEGKVTITLTYKGAREVVSVVTDAHAKVVDMRTSSSKTTTTAGATTIDYGTNSNAKYAYVSRIGESLYWNVEVDDSSIYMIDKVTYTCDGVETEMSSSGYGTNVYYYIYKMPKFTESLTINVTTKDKRMPVEVKETTDEVTNCGELELKKYTVSGSTYTYEDFVKSKQDGTKYIEKSDETTYLAVKLNVTDGFNTETTQYALTYFEINGTSYTLSDINEDGYYLLRVYSSAIKDSTVDDPNTINYKVTKYSNKLESNDVVGTYYGPNLVSATTSSKTYYSMTINKFARFGVATGSYSSTSSSSSGPVANPAVGTSTLDYITDGDTTKFKSGDTDEVYNLGDGWIFYKNRYSSSSSWTVEKSAFMKKDATLSSFAHKEMAATVDGTSNTQGIAQITLADGSETWAYFDLTNNVYKVGLTAATKTDLFNKNGVVVLNDGDEVYKTYLFTGTSTVKETTLDEYAGTYTASDASTSKDGDLVLNGVGFASLNGTSGYTYTTSKDNEGNVTVTVVGSEKVGASYGNNEVTRKFVIDKDNGTYTANNAKLVTFPNSYTNYKATGVLGSDGVSYDFLISYEYDDMKYFNSDGAETTAGKIYSGSYLRFDIDLSNGDVELFVTANSVSTLEGASSLRIKIVQDEGATKATKLIVNGTVGNSKNSSNSAPKGTTWTFNNTEFLAA